MNCRVLHILLTLALPNLETRSHSRCCWVSLSSDKSFSMFNDATGSYADVNASNSVLRRFACTAIPLIAGSMLKSWLPRILKLHTFIEFRVLIVLARRNGYLLY